MSARHARHEEYDPTCGECVQEAASEAFSGAAGSEERKLVEVRQPPVCTGVTEEGWLTWRPGDVRIETFRNPDGSLEHVAADASDQGPAVRVTESVDVVLDGKAIFRAVQRVTESAGTTEAHINGEMSFDDVRAAVEKALRARLAAENDGAGYGYDCWAYAADITATDVVYQVSGSLWQCSYEIDDAGEVTLGDPSPVVRTYAPAPASEPGGEDDMAAAEAGAMSWDSDKHPRAKKGSAGGGQFAPLSYDAKSNTGAGYSSAKGDDRVRAAQAALNKAGITDADGKPLKVDGKLGPKTTAAIRKWQTAHGLKADGKITPTLLAALKKGGGRQASKAKPNTAKKVVKGKESAESVQIVGRILEARGEDEDGGRIFGVRIIAYGDSRNRRRYPEAVMREAAHMYEGARAYDHHRSDEEMRSSTIAGLVGSYRDVVATAEGIEADLHLLPSATHAAEALDASIAAQEAGLPALIGLSHDVMARFRNVAEGGMQVQEATAITQVNSADLVADPAAGGMATRMVAGGIDGTGTEPAENEEGDVPTAKEILAALKEASDEDLAEFGFTRAAETTEKPAEENTTRETENADVTQRETEAASLPKGGFLAGLMIRQKVTDAGLPESVIEGVTLALPDRVTESDVDAQVAGLKNSLGLIERAGLTPQVGSAKVTQESIEKKIKALDAFFDGRFSEGYHSFKHAWEDFTGHRPRAWDADINRQILRESFGMYDSGDRVRVEEGVAHVREGMDSTSWNLVLGDSITRRMIAEYSRPELGVWRQIVSSVIPLNDFRTQRIDRVGGYGVLPTVNQGAPYQDLTSPGNEEITYVPAKKGGIESITFEMIANDDVRAISKIPVKLGMAAAQTLFRFIFDVFVNNAVTTYDGVALFHATHGNTGTSALSGSALSAVRAAMRQQAGYGDSKDILSIVPQTLIVPSSLEELAVQLATSIVAMPSGAPVGAASNIPNIHSRMNQPIVIDYYSDQNDWFTVADPAKVPTIEVGFYAGRQDPELFTQSDPNVGSVFDADKVTYKCRHIYGSGVLDHRGFYRNTL